jgi:hypothetical protein
MHAHEKAVGMAAESSQCSDLFHRHDVRPSLRVAYPGVSSTVLAAGPPSPTIVCGMQQIAGDARFTG